MIDFNSHPCSIWIVNDIIDCNTSVFCFSFLGIYLRIVCVMKCVSVSVCVCVCECVSLCMCVLVIVYDMLVNVNVIYYVHVCERSALSSLSGE